jgi:group II intron maturase
MAPRTPVDELFAACGPPRPGLTSQDPGHHTRRPIGHLSPDPSGGPLLAACTCAPGTPSAASPGEINPVVRGWMQYYGAFYRSALLPLLRRINAYLMRWLRKKYKRLASAKKARAAGSASPPSIPGCSPTGRGCPIPGGQDDRSRVTGDCQVRICGARRGSSSGLPDLSDAGRSPVAARPWRDHG